MDWQSIIAIGALVIATLSFLDRRLDKSLSIREHEEFRKNVEAEFTEVRTQVRRDIDRIENRK